MLFLCIFFSCNTTKYLDEDQALLKENKIKFESDKGITDKFSLRTDLLSLIEQKPNSRYIGIKREWLYLKAQEMDEDRWLTRQMLRQGEEPTIYDSSSTNESMRDIKNYMFNQGFFETDVKHDLQVKKKKAFSTYLVDPNELFIIDELNYTSGDPGITQLLDSLEATSLLELGQPIEDSKYKQEKARITKAFLNQGYSDFYANLVSPLKVDTTTEYNLVSLEIYLPPTSESHVQKYIGDIDIYTDYVPGNPNMNFRDTVISDITFYIPEEGPSVRYETILDKVFLREGNISRKVSVDNTYRGLSDLGVYKFITVTPIPDPDRIDIIHYKIQLTKSNTWVWDSGLDLNYSTLQSQGFGRNLFGLTASANLENRNLFKRAISLELSGELGAEVNLAQIDSFNTLNASLEAVLNIPRFTGFPGTLRFLSLMKLGKKHVINPSFFSEVENRSATQLRTRYQNVSVAAFYKYEQFDIDYGYDIPMNNRKRYNIGTIGINYYRPDTLSKFLEITQGAEYFLRSFIGDRLFTGFLYRNFSFYYQSKPREDGDYWIVNFANEVSGLEVWGINSLYNAFTNKTDNFQLTLDKNIDFARFTTFEFQWRYYWQLRGNSSLAFRVNPGVAISFDTLNVPFVKQFYVGGPQSIRAWQIRELGPGSNPISEQNRNRAQPYFSSGDIKLEFNVEYRFELFWLLESAVFLDAGNVWLLDSRVPENNFSADFIKEFAIGTGVGLRMDLTYAMLRLDLGYKLRNPYPDESGSYWLPDTDLSLFESINFNLAIGYPF